MSLFEEMKDNRVPWAWLDCDQREVLIEAKKNNNMVYMDNHGCWRNHSLANESEGVVYRVNKYCAEPEKRPEIPDKLTDYCDANKLYNGIIDCMSYIYKLLDELEGKP